MVIIYLTPLAAVAWLMFLRLILRLFFLLKFIFFKPFLAKAVNSFSLHWNLTALSAGIPFLDGYLNPNATFGRGRGVNFAVAGSTALPVHVLAEKGIVAPATNSSLATQLDWMFSYFNGICYDEEGHYIPSNSSI